MKSVRIAVKAGGQYELWLVVHADGRIIEHVENDGYAALRHGLEKLDTEITMADVADREQRYGKPLVEQVTKALASFDSDGAEAGAS